MSWALGTLLAHEIYGTSVRGQKTSAVSNGSAAASADELSVDPGPSAGTDSASLDALVRRTLAVVPMMASGNDWQGLAHVSFMADMIQKVGCARGPTSPPYPHPTSPRT